MPDDSPQSDPSDEPSDSDAETRDADEPADSADTSPAGPTDPSGALGWLLDHQFTVSLAFAAVLLALFVFAGTGEAVVLVLWLAVVLFGLWLLYRFVVAVERIASAHERLAAARDRETESSE